MLLSEGSPLANSGRPPFVSSPLIETYVVTTRRYVVSGWYDILPSPLGAFLKRLKDSGAYFG